MRTRTAAGRCAVIILAAGLLVACRDVGLEYNIGREEAEQREFLYSEYEASADQAETLRFADRNWLMSGAVEHIPESALRTVGMAGGSTLYAPAWEAPPYDRLYVRSGTGRWHPVTTVP